MDRKSNGAARGRWLACGHSVDTDAFIAGAAATRLAVQGRDDAHLLIVFCSDAYDLEQLTKGLASEAQDIPMIGCSTAGEIATSGPHDASVVVTALGGDGFSVVTGVARDASSRLRVAGGDAVRACVANLDEREHAVVLLLTDGLGGDQMDVIRGAYDVVGAQIPLVGGCAGDDLKMDATYQLYNGEVLSDAVVAAAISSDAPIGIGVQHGWRPVGDPMLVSRSTGVRVEQLDDQPALDVYLRRLNAPDEVCHDAEAFTRFAMTHPLGITRRSGAEVRYVAEADFETRSLVCIAGVPQGGLAWIMEGDEDSVLEATDGACSEALAGLAGHPPLGLVAFDCIARRGVLGEAGIGREIDRIATFADGAPVAGFYTYGEIARTTGRQGFHNQTLVVLALG
ncbi:MAG TPA: FIST N-terminal domain-containing protein [Acidimicrobiales bacterium]|nr:FIST N-terminal domain-containing protein [Acidimicrobiales bacterium]